MVQSHIVVSRSSWPLLSVFFVISRSSLSVVLIVVVSRRGQSFFRGQSAFFLVVVVSRRGQSFFVDGVYILWWLCTRIY